MVAFYDVNEEFFITIIWISLLDMRVHLMNHQILFAIRFIFSRPLQVDQATIFLTKPSVAPIFVELHVTKKLS